MSLNVTTDSWVFEETLFTIQNNLDKDLVIELSCHPDSPRRAYGAVGSTIVSVDLVDFGCRKKMTLPAGQVGVIDTI